MMLYQKELDYLEERLLRESERISDHLDDYIKLVEFLIIAEDHRYYKHPGFDLIAICRAIIKNTFYGKKEGASTIEQQLVRVITEDYRCTVLRKIKEIYLAYQLNGFIDKFTIAAIYLDIAYYGTDYQNLLALLKKFKVKLSSNLDDEVCAEIVARLKYPEPHIMTRNRAIQIEQRKRYILRYYYRMKKHECR